MNCQEIINFVRAVNMKLHEWWKSRTECKCKCCQKNKLE